MKNNNREKLTREYIERFSKFQYWILDIMGYGRFSVKNNRIVEKSWSSVLYGTALLATAIVAVIHLIYETSIRTNSIMLTELLILVEISIIINMFIASITFGDRYSPVNLIKHSIEIDLLLGIEETKFMRDITDAAYTIMSIPVAIVQCTVVAFMYLSFKVSILVHITGSSYFIWAFFALIYINNLVSRYSFLNLRTRYINVALMKTINVNIEYIPDLFLFNGIFWKPKHDNHVKFHEKADIKDFVKIYKMLFDHLKLYLKSNQFSIFTGMLCITMSTLLSVQAVLIYGKTGMDNFRKYVMVSWVVLSWGFLLLISVLIDLFSRQIEQTKLICTYAQLRSINDEAVYKFTKEIFRVLEARVARASIYGLFFFDPGMMLSLTASIFVYITAQLQISMSVPDEISYVGNGTVVN